MEIRTIHITVKVKMKPDKKNIKFKIDQLDAEIKSLEIKINEISWQRNKYKQFYEKFLINKVDT